MNEQRLKRSRFVTWKRIVAAILVLAMLAASALGSMIEISISSDGDTDLARNYLIEENPYINSGAAARAIERVRSMQRADDFDSWYSRACIQIADEEYEDALVSLDKCLEFLDGGSPDIPEDDILMESAAQLREDILIKKGCLLELLGRNPEAIEVLEQSLTISGKTRKRTEVYALLGQLYFIEQDYESAAGYYQIVVDKAKSDDEIVVYLYLYGMCQVQSEKYEEAEALLTRAIAADDHQEGIYYYRGISRLFLQDYEGAIDDLTESINRGSMVQTSLYSRAVAALSADPEEFEGPCEDLRAAIEYKGPDADPEIAEQAGQLLNVLEEESRKETVYESESEQ